MLLFSLRFTIKKNSNRKEEEEQRSKASYNKVGSMGMRVVFNKGRRLLSAKGCFAKAKPT